MSREIASDFSTRSSSIIITASASSAAHTIAAHSARTDNAPPINGHFHQSLPVCVFMLSLKGFELVCIFTPRALRS